MSGYGGEPPGSPLDRFRSKRIAAGVLAGVCATLWAEPALAYRPFDGTDAAVADVGEIEIELQPIGAIRAAGTIKGLSDAVLNYGFADRWELVLQGTAQPTPEGAGPLSVPNGAFLKYVLQPGVLQDKKGWSVATEFGPLLPEAGGSGVGFEWNGIASQRWEWGTVHLNTEANLTPDQHGELFFDAIVEGPNKWKVRPVFEIYSDSIVNVSQTFSALAGAIWQLNDKLSFDVGFRYASVDGRPVSELRAGMTFGFPLNIGKPMSAELPSSAGIGRR